MAPLWSIDQHYYRCGDCTASHKCRAERKRSQQQPITKCLGLPIDGLSHADCETLGITQNDRSLPAICVLHSLLIITKLTHAITN